jgi:uncharacterized protein YbcI
MEDSIQGATSLRGQQAKAISRGMVGLMKEIVGRGPVSARTTIGRDHVLVMFHETLTPGERNLVEAARIDEVLAVRAAYQDLLRPNASKLIEETLGRKVVGFMGGNHFDPDLAAEVFALAPLDDGRPETAPEEADHADA